MILYPNFQKRKLVTIKRNTFLGAWSGVLGTALFLLVFQKSGIGFSIPSLLVVLLLGSIFGAFGALLAEKGTESRLFILLASALVGFAAPICLIQTFFWCSDRVIEEFAVSSLHVPYEPSSATSPTAPTLHHSTTPSGSPALTAGVCRR